MALGGLRTVGGQTLETKEEENALNLGLEFFLDLLLACYLAECSVPSL